MNKLNNEETGIIFAVVAAVMFILVGVIWSFFISPYYTIWYQGQVGKSELAHAEYNRQIKTLEAKAFYESSKAYADAEVIRAEGVARANQIIGDSLHGNEAYLRYLWIQGLQTNNMQVVYVPTEANLPILESTRLNGTRGDKVE